MSPEGLENTLRVNLGSRPETLAAEKSSVERSGEEKESPHLFREILDVGDIVICATIFSAPLAPWRGMMPMKAPMMYQLQCPRAPSDPERSWTRLHRPLKQTDFSTNAEMMFR